MNIYTKYKYLLNNFSIISKIIGNKRNMNISDKNKKNKYSVRARNKLPYKSRVSLKVKGFILRLSNFFRFSLKRKRYRSLKNSIVKFIIPFFLTILAIFTLTFVLSIYDAKKNEMIYEQEKAIDEKKDPKTITLHYGTKTYEVMIESGTLRDVVKKADLKIEDNYEVIPDINYSIKYFDEAWVIMWEEKVVSQIVETNYNVIEQVDINKKPFEREVIMAGVKGESEFTFLQKYKNDILHSQVKLNEKIITLPIDEIVSVGKKQTQE